MRFITLFVLTLPFVLIARDNPFILATPADNNAVKAETKRVSKPKIHPQRHQKTADPIVVSEKKTEPQTKQNRDTKEVINTSKARFVVRENSVYIETKDKVIKHFSITSPPSLVIDFKGYSDFASKRNELHTKPFTKLEMGAHGNRYRVVIRLDRQHNYKLSKRKYGQVVTILD